MKLIYSFSSGEGLAVDAICLFICETVGTSSQKIVDDLDEIEVDRLWSNLKARPFDLEMAWPFTLGMGSLCNI